jgi:hypothetical protein
METVSQALSGKKLLDTLLFDANFVGYFSGISTVAFFRPMRPSSASSDTSVRISSQAACAGRT